ncbi:unnamed protein product [Heterobilharzia americana]|nr:unnamed protein product [Heterobilharzia americana]
MIWNSGFRVLRVHNEFITRTGPNHMSLVTGMHEESHGIIDNVFYDPNLKDTFDLVNEQQASQSKWFDVGSEPIWVTNQRHGYQSAVYFWPGSDAKIKGYLPTFHFSPYNPEVSFVDRINRIVEYLSLNEVTLGLIYFHEPDSQGHLTGPDSSEIYNIISKLNDDIGHLLSLVDAKPSLKASLNIIVTSDHGMSSVSTNRTIILHDYIDESMYFSPGPDHRIVWSLWPKDGVSPIDLYKMLVKKHSKMNVFLKENVPTRLYYSKNRRISPLIVYCEPGWMIVRSKESVVEFTKLGDHGYDPEDSEMSPFFLAMGPGFRNITGRRTVNSIRLIDIYPLMCALLNLTEPAPNNGSLSRVVHLLRDHGGYLSSFVDMFTVGVILVCCLTLSTTFMICACISCTNYPYLFPGYRHQNNKHQKPINQPSLLLLKRRYRNNCKTAIQLEGLKSTRKLNNRQSRLHKLYLKHESTSQADRQQLLGDVHDDNTGIAYYNNDTTAEMEDEYEEYNRFSTQHIDDKTFLDLLRQPNGRYP